MGICIKELEIYYLAFSRILEVRERLLMEIKDVYIIKIISLELVLEIEISLKS